MVGESTGDSLPTSDAIPEYIVTEIDKSRAPLVILAGVREPAIIRAIEKAGGNVTVVRINAQASTRFYRLIERGKYRLVPDYNKFLRLDFEETKLGLDNILPYFTVYSTHESTIEELSNVIMKLWV